MPQKIRPLSRGQQLFLQRLLASHVLTDADAQALYEEIGSDDDMGPMGRDLPHCLGIINASLAPAFGLEVRTVSLSRGVAPPPPSQGEDGEGEDTDGSIRNGRGAVKYHAIVNKSSDDVAKAAANHGPFARNPHELALFRLILERTVEAFLDRLDGDGGTEEDADGEGGEERAGGRRGGAAAASAGPGCSAALSRMDALNLRTELEGPHRNKVGLHEAERAVSALVREGWLIPAPRPASAVADEEGGEGATPDGGGTPGSGSRRSGRKRVRRSMDGLGVEGGGGRTHLMIGPRTYMELPELLTDLGLGRDRLPQFILHGAR